MDQPTYLKLHITGTEQSVTQAADSAARVINQNSPREYFENRVKNMLESNFNKSFYSYKLFLLELKWFHNLLLHIRRLI